ncbi:MAG: hypothetical protein AAF135_26385, partial [Bacteroidota bacterium]
WRIGKHVITKAYETMKISLNTYGKNGVLDIMGNPQESILYFKGKPIHYQWYAEVGTTWRYHIAQGLTRQAVQTNYRIRQILKEGIQHEGDFVEAASYFVDFLAYGTYTFGYYEICKGIHMESIHAHTGYESYNTYGGMPTVTATQHSLDGETVGKYKEAILRGDRPVMVWLHVEDSWIFHMVDGHHKQVAYRLAQVPPHVLFITKMGNVYKSVEETLTLAQKMGCTKAHYLDKMKEEKQDLSHYQRQKLDLDKTFRRIEKS